MRTVIDNVKSVLVLPSKALSATTTSAAVDTLGYNTAKLVINVGVCDFTTGDETQVLTLTECDTVGGTYVDTGLVLPTVVGVTNNNSVLVQAVEGLGTNRKRFLKLVATLAGTSPSFQASATMEFGRAFRNAV
jgi:uncharacterized membrane protein